MPRTGAVPTDRQRPSLRRFRIPGSMRSRLALGLSVLLAVIAVFLLVHVPAQMERDALAITAEKAEAIGEIAAYSLEGPVHTADFEAMRAVIAGIRNDDDIAYVVILDEDGRLLAEDGIATARSAGYMRADEWEPEVVGGVMRVVESIRREGRLVSRVYMGLSLASLRERVARQRADIAGGIGLSFLIALVGVWAVGSLVTRPLGRIMSVARDVSAGETRRRVNLPPHGEVGELATVFDTMLDRLESAYSEVRLANRGLEERIEARTNELRHAYDERLRAEMQALESERRFRTIFHSAPIAIFLLDRDLRLLEANPACAAMWGCTREQLLGRHLQALGKSTGESNWAEVADLRDGRSDHLSREIQVATFDGSVVWGHGSLSTVRDEDGAVRFMVAMVENVTSRKELEEQLRQAQKLEAIGRLAGGIAHDFNNLLTTINGVSDEMLAELPPTDRHRADLEEIARAGDRAATLTRQLLAFSRQQMLQPRVMDVNAAVEELGAMLLRMIGEDVRLALRLDPAIPRVKADPGQVTQVILNLAVNARDAMPHGGRLLIETSATDIDTALGLRLGIAPGPAVEIRVRDEGHGMDAATMANIFEPFFTTKEVGRGTGLGLATVYGIVKQSGGAIEVESEVGRGTTFTILLPATASPEAAPSAPTVAPRPAGTETLLLVEDEPSVRALASRVLRRCGYTVIEHASPEEALRALSHADTRIDAVLTDVIMPGLSGPQMVEQLIRTRPDLKVLYMSGYPRDQIAHLRDDAGDSAFVQKPMSPSDLGDAVRRLLDGRPAAAA